MFIDDNKFINNIDDFETEGKRVISIEDSIEIPKSYTPYNEVPFTLKGELVKQGDSFRFSGSLKAGLKLICDLCLSEFSKTIEFPVFGIFRREETSEEEECYIIEGDIIDLKPMVYSEILLNFPMRNVCREDCKGLCPKCGHNLNDGDCGCDRVSRNPEFEKLLSMFNEDQDKG